MSSTEERTVAHKTILEIMREGNYNPKAGRPIPIELIYEANTITREEYEAEVERQRRVAAAGYNYKAIKDQEQEAAILDGRARRAGVPERCLRYAIDLTHIAELNEGKSVYICGAQGSHKTTMGCSMLRGWLKDNMFGIACFVRSTTLLNDFTDTYSTRDTMDEVMSQYGGVGLLLVDDLGKEVPTPRVVSLLWELFDRRYGAGLPSIVTTQFAPDRLAQRLGESGEVETALAIVSRFRETFSVIDMGGVDRR